MRRGIKRSRGDEGDYEESIIFTYLKRRWNGKILGTSEEFMAEYEG